MFVVESKIRARDEGFQMCEVSSRTCVAGTFVEACPRAFFHYTPKDVRWSINGRTYCWVVITVHASLPAQKLQSISITCAIYCTSTNSCTRHGIVILSVSHVRKCVTYLYRQIRSKHSCDNVIQLLNSHVVQCCREWKQACIISGALQ